MSVLVDPGPLGRHVHRLRIRLGLKQNELAAAAGLPPSVVSYVENGHHIPSLTTAVSLADALGVSVDDLVAPAVIPDPAVAPAASSGVPPTSSDLGAVGGAAGSATTPSASAEREDARPGAYQTPGTEQQRAG